MGHFYDADNFLNHSEGVYSWIGHGLQSEPTLAFLLWLSDFKTKTIFGFLVKKLGVIFLFFFRKVEKWAFPAKNDVLEILAEIRWFSHYSDM